MSEPLTVHELRTALDARISPDGRAWLAGALERLDSDSSAVRTLFPAAGRRCGRGPLHAPEAAPAVTGRARMWTVDDAARTLLMAALPLPGSGLAEEIATLYRYGDAAEKRGILRGLGPLDAASTLGDRALPLVHDGLRTNDTRLLTAALATYGAHHLPPQAYRHGVLKCVFLGIPVDDIAGLDERADPELARMLTDYAREREAAGRDVPADLRRIVTAIDTHAPREA